MSRLLTATGKEPPEPVLSLTWRYDALRKAGYPVAEAMEIAELRHIDLHEACELLAQGCSVDVAMQILL